MIKAVIIDDEINAVSAIEICLKEYCPNVEVIGAAQTEKDGIHQILSKSPDVVFLDIEMPHMGGFELLAQFPNRKFSVIFISAYNEHAIKAFKVNAIDYLLKPINIHELILAVDKIKTDTSYVLEQNEKLNKLIESYPPGINKIGIPSSEGVEFFNPKEIIKVNAEGSYSTVYLLSGEKKIFAKNLKSIESLLVSYNFFRVHRSHIINLDYVKKYHSFTNRGDIEMTDGSIIPVARSYKKHLVKLIA